MLEAFEYGAPPTAASRPASTASSALLAQETDIREVIAFPKTKSGGDLMTGAPLPVDPTALDTLGLELKADVARELENADTSEEARA